MCDCGIEFTNENGKPIVESLTKNISLTQLDFKNNNFEIEFQKAVEKELGLN